MSNKTPTTESLLGEIASLKRKLIQREKAVQSWRARYETAQANFDALAEKAVIRIQSDRQQISNAG